MEGSKEHLEYTFLCLDLCTMIAIGKVPRSSDRY
jgi:hypothetical protein